MPGNAAATLGGPAGLRLKAWAVVTGTGSMVASSGFTSWTRSAAGTYAGTITAALSDYTKSFVRVRPMATAIGQWFAHGYCGTGTSCSVYTNNAAAAADVERFHVEVWEP